MFSAISIAVLLLGPVAGATSQQLPSPSPPEVRLATVATQGKCAIADSLRKAGLLDQAKVSYSALLDGQNPPNCAVTGLGAVAGQSENAAKLEADGDAAAADGNPSEARTDYNKALQQDSGNQAALSGLQKLDQQGSDSIRQARDHWDQIIANTLVPLGQFFLWLLAVFAAIYILYLLTRIVSRWLPVKAVPSRLRCIKIFAVSSFVLAAATAILTIYLGVYKHHENSTINLKAFSHNWNLQYGHWWLASLIANGLLTITGCLLSAWYLRSGTGVQFSVVNESGETDSAASAFLAGRLNLLGATPPRGADIPEGTDVTSLASVLTLLPGGSALSALVGFLLTKAPVTPWKATVTLISDDHLLVTLHRNERQVKTVLADKNSLFSPNLFSNDAAASSSTYLQALSRQDLLTIAAAIILVSMAIADKRSPLRTGLDGATSWKSVAGQVIASSQGLDGNEDLSKVLLDRAIDIDPNNLAAKVAKVNIDGRRAGDDESRKVFAKQIGALAGLPEMASRGYEALRLRALYSSAAGWCNSYLDDRTEETLKCARYWTGELIENLYTLNIDAIRPLADNLRPEAYILVETLKRFEPEPPPGWPSKSEATRHALQTWAPPESLHTSGISYAKACQAAIKDEHKEALEDLEQAVAVDNGLRIWARRDPCFSSLRANRRQDFLKIVGDQLPTSFTEVKPISKYGSQLSDIGVHEASDLENMTSTSTKRHLFADAVGVPQLVVERWRNIASLAIIPAGPNPAQLDLLIATGIDSVPALLAAIEEDIEHLVDVLAIAGIYSAAIIRKEDLRCWAAAATASA